MSERILNVKVGEPLAASLALASQTMGALGFACRAQGIGTDDYRRTCSTGAARL